MPFLARALQHLDAVFVRLPNSEENILTVQSLKTCHRIGRDQFIRVTDVASSIGISNRGGDVIFFAAHYGRSFDVWKRALSEQNKARGRKFVSGDATHVSSHVTQVEADRNESAMSFFPEGLPQLADGRGL